MHSPRSARVLIAESNEAVRKNSLVTIIIITLLLQLLHLCKNYYKNAIMQELLQLRIARQTICFVTIPINIFFEKKIYFIEVLLTFSIELANSTSFSTLKSKFVESFSSSLKRRIVGSS